MLRLLIPILTYIIGYVISYYTIEEIKNKRLLFKQVIKFNTVLLILLVFYELLLAEPFFSIVSLLLLFFFFSLFKQKNEFISNSFIGVISGALYSNYYIIILASALLFFKSNRDFLNKKVLKQALNELLIYALVALFTAVFSNNLLAVVGCAGLLRLIILS